MRPLVLSLIALLVAFSTSAQAPIPTVMTPERPLEEIAPSYGQAMAFGISAVATDGENFGVITSTDMLFRGYRHAITIVDRNGVARMPLSIETLDFGHFPGIASSGRTWLAVTGGLGATTGYLLDSSGNLLKTFVIHEPTRTQRSSHDTAGIRSVTWTSSEYIVLTWLEDSGLSDGTQWALIATRVSEDGEIIQNDILVPQGDPGARIASRNGVTVIAWSPYAAGVPFRAQVATLSSAGVISTSETNDIEGRVVALTSGGDGFLIMLTGTPTTDLYGGPIVVQHLDPSGRPDALPLTLSGLLSSGLAAATWTGTDYLVAWSTDAQDIVAVHTDGRSASAAEKIERGRYPTLASNGDLTLLVWCPFGANRVQAKALPSGDTHPVHYGFRYHEQLKPLAIWNGLAPQVAWQDTDRGALIAVPGNTPHVISEGAEPVAAAVGPASLLLSWFRSGRLFAVVGDAPPVALDAGAVDPDLVRAVWTGTDFLIVWARTASAGMTAGLWGARISAGGQLMLERLPFATPAGNVAELAIAASQSAVLAVYKEAAWAAPAQGVLLTAAGAEPVGIIADPENLATSVSVASDGSSFLVTWIAASFWPVVNDYIGGRRLDPSGHDLGEASIFSTGGDKKWFHRTFWTGSEYLAVWTKQIEMGKRYELQAARIAAEGRLLDYPPQRIGTIDGMVQSIDRATAGQLLIAYRRDTPAGTRAFARVATFLRRAASHR